MPFVVAALAVLAARPVPVDATGWPQPAAGPTMTGDPELILTFDDGPDPQKTPKVLDALAAHHIKAVFFLIGDNIVKKKESAAIIARIIAEGHIIANHTMHHGELCHIKDPLRAAAEIDEGRAVIDAVAAMRVFWFRAPYGARCERLDAMLAERGINHFHWDLDPQEWRHGSSKKTLDYLIKSVGQMKGRNVLLMHDIKTATVDALPEFLDWIDAENARRKELRIRRIRILQSWEVAIERLPPGTLEWMAAVAPTTHGLSQSIASVLP